MLDQVRTLAEEVPTPDIPVPDNLMQYVYFGIAAIIVIAIVTAVIKAIPKWVMIAVALILAVVAGYIKVK